MKRITFNGGSIVTSNAIAAALLDYTTTLTDAENSVTVDVTVLEDDGETTVHTLVLNATSQFDVADVADVAGMSEEEEARRFPVPEMPQVGMTAVVGASDAARIADDVDAVMDEIDEGLGH